MCGRFDIDARHPEISKLIQKLPENERQLKFGEIFPGGIAPVLNGQNDFPEIMPVKWGYPLKKGKGLLINARAESAREKPWFAKGLQTMPLAIPATGFFEWKKSESTGKKEKFLFSLPDKYPFFLAGVGRIFPEEEESARFVILTTSANESVLPYHDRMPVLLGWDEAKAWLDKKETDYFLERIPFNLRAEKR